MQCKIGAFPVSHIMQYYASKRVVYCERAFDTKFSFYFQAGIAIRNMNTNHVSGKDKIGEGKCMCTKNIKEQPLLKKY